MARDPELLTSIHRIDQEIVQNKIALRQTQDEVDRMVEGLMAFKFLQEAESQIRALRVQLKVDTENDGEITARMDQMAKIRFDLRDLNEILSHHLIRYYMATEDSQVPLPKGKAKQLIVSARLGKEQVYQERLDFDAKN
jgi:hypothetical protein